MVPFELIHSDVWGPSPISTQQGTRWFIIFVEDCTRMTWLYTMRNKGDVSTIFKSFYHMIQNQYSLPIKVLRSDSGGEYINLELSEFLQEKGILHETTCPQTPQQNGVAERKNRHILETTRAHLIGSYAPKAYWADAITYAVYLMNRVPSRVLSFRTPLEQLDNHVTISSSLHLQPRVFGCTVYVHLHKNQRSKLDPCAEKCIFLGFSPQQNGYQYYHPPTRRMYATMDVTFSKVEMFFLPEHSSHHLQGEISSNEDYSWIDLQDNNYVNAEPGDNRYVAVKPKTAAVQNFSLGSGGENSTSTSQTEQVELDRDTQTTMTVPEQVEVPFDTPTEDNNPLFSPYVQVDEPADIYEVNNSSINEVSNSEIIELLYVLPPRQNSGKPPDRYSPGGKVRYAIVHVSTHRLSPKNQAFVDKMAEIKIPTKVEEALKDPKWVEAIQVEMDALQKNGTWSVVSLPKGKKLVGCKWDLECCFTWSVVSLTEKWHLECCYT